MYLHIHKPLQDRGEVTQTVLYTSFYRPGSDLKTQNNC